MQANLAGLSAGAGLAVRCSFVDDEKTMYTPGHNAENDWPTILQFLRANPLCALVTETAHGMVATHIPVVVHQEGDGFGVIRGHVARANTQWKEFLADKEALAIFTGPQHYISASWYPSKQVHGKEVPTWNYVAAHVYGRLRAIEDPAWLYTHLKTLTDANETIAEVPWKVEDAPPGFIEKTSGGIVGFELEITRVEGKWKVSQNRNDADAAAVAHELGKLGTPESETMRELVENRRPRK